MLDFYFLHYPLLFPILATILGLIIGSFLNVVIHRLPIIMEREWQKEFAEAYPELKLKVPEGVFNISLPRSRCPKCEAPIKAIHNIPVIGWLSLKGRCRACGDKISPRYPLIELLSGFLSLTIALLFEPSLYAVALLGFTWVLLCATFIDLDTMLLPDSLTLPLMWAGLALSVFGISPLSLQDAVIGAMAGYLSLWSVYWLFKLLTGKEGMGYGDFKLLAALGAWLGWQSLPLIILLSSLVGLIFGIIQLRLKQQGVEKAFPFGPYLAIAGWVYLIVGDDIVTWYLSRYIGGY
ncbi:prepilin peptidase [Vibrio superstes]|uniref:Prepilin leader peptidase/N-methyltransferase n=1 Tax=Vibrio superstes NBRC 103154 TaxID=1219062 RepID=A0A511QUS0_9VIBR|nr:A24 family peptidase [Vibrio superstes]GEM81105.1 type 4 prepilin-like proteins leader peptide-processing enzyme [Vibrio superstes NBRC 103154]